MRGFQLWLNLPARDKMTAPKYQEFGPERIPSRRPRRRRARPRSSRGRSPASPARSAAGDRSDLSRSGDRAGRRVRAAAAARITRRSCMCSRARCGSGAAPGGHACARTSSPCSAKARRSASPASAPAPTARARARDPGRGPPAARAGGQVRPVRDEHARGAEPGVPGLPEREILSGSRSNP